MSDTIVERDGALRVASRTCAAPTDTALAREVSFAEDGPARAGVRGPQNQEIAIGSRAPRAAAEFGEFIQRRRFASLDGLRMFGVLAVVWHHTVARGLGGVSLFFALSGFLITTRLIRSGRREALFIGAFYRRTARRILPLYFAVLAIYVAIVALFERDVTARARFFANLPAFATFTANWFVDLDHPRVIFYFVWSLSAQVQFYLLWPWVERARRPCWAVLVAVAVLAISQAIAALTGDDARQVLWLRVLSGMPAGIMIGVLLAHALHARHTFSLLRRLFGRRGSGAGALGLVVALALFPKIGGIGHEMLAAIAHAVLIATCVLREDHDLAWIMRWSPIARAGAVSYGIYLLHMLAVNAARRCETWWNIESVSLEFALGVAIALGLALISHRFLERRFLAPRDEAQALGSSAASSSTSVNGFFKQTCAPAPAAMPRQLLESM